jgi:uncharacterized protein (TIGR00730 family)
MKVSHLAVFCGSQAGKSPLYLQETTQLGVLMAQQGLTLVYGGGNKGLMGAVANAVLDGGGKAIGVIPEVLIEWEQEHRGLTELRIVSDMHVRKKMIYELCDAAVVLPGGNGTLDELFEMLTWNTLKIHNKKIFLLNCDGFYDHLVQHIEMIYNQGFLYEDWKNRLIVCKSAADIISFLD